MTLVLNYTAPRSTPPLQVSAPHRAAPRLDNGPALLHGPARGELVAETTPVLTVHGEAWGVSLYAVFVSC